MVKKKTCNLELPNWYKLSYSCAAYTTVEQCNHRLGKILECRGPEDQDDNLQNFSLNWDGPMNQKLMH